MRYVSLLCLALAACGSPARSSRLLDDVPDTAAPPVDAGGEIAAPPDAGEETQAENAPPTATISQPAGGAVVVFGAPVTFVAQVGDDQQGQDWSWEGTTETRTYTGGTFTLYLAGHPMMTGPLPDVSVTIDYFDSCVLADDLASVETAAGPVSDASAASPSAVQAAAKAFALDVAEVGVRFAFQARLPAVQVDFQGQGRWGAFFEVLSGTIEPGPCP